MPNGFMQQHPGPPRGENHRHRTCRRVHGVEIHERLPHRLARIFPRFLIRVVGQDPGEIVTPASPRETAFSSAIPLDDHGNVEAHQRAHVARECAVAAYHEVCLKACGKTCRHLLDAGVQPARECIRAPEKRHLVTIRERRQGIDVRVARRHIAPTVGLNRAVTSGTGDRARRIRSLAQRGQDDVVSVGEPCLLAADGTHSHPPIDAEGPVLDDPVLERPGLQAPLLEEQFTRIHLSMHEPSDQTGYVLLANFARLPQVPLGGLNELRHSTSSG